MSRKRWTEKRVLALCEAIGAKSRDGEYWLDGQMIAMAYSKWDFAFSELDGASERDLAMIVLPAMAKAGTFSVLETVPADGKARWRCSLGPFSEPARCEATPEAAILAAALEWIDDREKAKKTAKRKEGTGR
jgi:hypothetical protein